jgi:hypothetical protein
MTDLTKTLTPNEQAAALVLLQECLNGMGGKEPADLEGDEYTWCAADTLVAAGWTKAEAAGTYGALIAKGIVTQCKGEPCDVLDGWRDVATLWPLWVEAGKLASTIRGTVEVYGLTHTEEDEPSEALLLARVNALIGTPEDEEEALIAALVQAGFDEQEAIDLGTPFPGIICSTLRAHAITWKGTRGAFIKAVGLASGRGTELMADRLSAREQRQLLAVIRDQIPASSRWSHRKGGVYKVVGHALSSTDAKLVVLYTQHFPLSEAADLDQYFPVIWARPASEWLDGRFKRV